MIAGLAPRKDRRPDALRRGWCPGALRPMSSGDGLIARLRIVGGAVTPTAARAIAEAAAKFGNGHIDLTSRGNLQIRGVGASTLAPLQSMLGALGLIDVEPAAEAVRNVMASPLAGFDPSALLDIRPSVTALDERLRSDRALWRLPAKFGFAIDDGGCLSVAREAAEITFSAVERDGRVQFSIRLAGRPAGLCEVDELSDEAARLACAFLQLRGSGEGAQRMAALVKGIGVEQIAHNAGLRFAAAELGDISEAPPPRPLGERHLGRFAALGVGAPFGRLDAARLKLERGRRVQRQDDACANWPCDESEGPRTEKAVNGSGKIAGHFGGSRDLPTANDFKDSFGAELETGQPSLVLVDVAVLLWCKSVCETVLKSAIQVNSQIGFLVFESGLVRVWQSCLPLLD